MGNKESSTVPTGDESTLSSSLSKLNPFAQKKTPTPYTPSNVPAPSVPPSTVGGRRRRTHRNRKQRKSRSKRGGK